MPDKIKLFQTVASFEMGERVPRVRDAFWFALPYVLDPTVDWSQWFTGTKPRAFAVSVRETGHPQAGKVYPTDYANATSKANFLGIIIDGHDYEKDPNVTVTLAGGIPLKYLQSTPAKPYETIDADVVAALGDLGLNRVKDLVFWNKVQ